ncbi:MAG: hypothetical protein ACI9F9_002859 [Candidatus Paceibacteria bacterium]|jgi:hypothetical protein
MMHHARVRCLLFALLLSTSQLGACGKANVQATRSSVFQVSVDLPERGWMSSVTYEHTDFGARLTLDGAVFELLDGQAYRIDWEELGLSGLTTSTSKVSYASTKESQGGFFTVMGKPVEIRDDTLLWGSESLGTVSEGDVFVVDAEGLQAAVN